MGNDSHGKPKDKPKWGKVKVKTENRTPSAVKPHATAPPTEPGKKRKAIDRIKTAGTAGKGEIRKGGKGSEN